MRLTTEQRAEIKRRHEEAGGRHGIISALMQEYGVSWKTVQAIVGGKYAVNAKVDATTDEHENPAYLVKGTSTLYGPDGKIKQKWVKAEKDRSPDAARLVFEAFLDDLPKLPARRAEGKSYSKDLLSVIPFGDPHIGMHAWGEETGDDFDLKIAERDLCGAVDRLVNTAPDTEECLIANLGDYFHADNMDAKTWRSGHSLDVDSRWAKVLRVGLKAMRQCIESALAKHRRVTVINAIGNHDDHSSLFLTIALKHIYEDEPRVVINDLPRAVHFHEFGKVMLAVTHGHSIKMANLPQVAASEEAAMWGRTEHRYGLTGHIHHDSAKEYAGMKVESFRTLAARDAYAASHGYRSGRDMKLLVMHREFGEVERHTVSVEMLRRQGAKKLSKAG